MENGRNRYSTKLATYPSLYVEIYKKSKNKSKYYALVLKLEDRKMQKFCVFKSNCKAHKG